MSQARALRYEYDLVLLEDRTLKVFEVRGDDGLAAPQEVPGGVPLAALVELAHHVVEEQDWVLPRLPSQILPRRELQRQRRQPLLPLRPVGRDAHLAEEHRQVSRPGAARTEVVPRLCRGCAPL